MEKKKKRKMKEKKNKIKEKDKDKDKDEGEKKEEKRDEKKEKRFKGVPSETGRKIEFFFLKKMFREIVTKLRPPKKQILSTQQRKRT